MCNTLRTSDHERIELFMQNEEIVFVAAGERLTLKW